MSPSFSQLSVSALFSFASNVMLALSSFCLSEMGVHLRKYWSDKGSRTLSIPSRSLGKRRQAMGTSFRCEEMYTQRFTLPFLPVDTE
jgi:hypothetical protein